MGQVRLDVMVQAIRPAAGETLPLPLLSPYPSSTKSFPYFRRSIAEKLVIRFSYIS